MKCDAHIGNTAGVIFTDAVDVERQLAAARTAQAALADALEAVNGGYTLDAAGVCVDDALRALYELTGENAGDDVIDEVFSRFCVGK